MEIGPINAIRPVAAVRPSASARDLSGVFAVELREQRRDDTYSAGRASRGLEDENAEEEMAEMETATTGNDETASGSISFFA